MIEGHTVSASDGTAMTTSTPSASSQVPPCAAPATGASVCTALDAPSRRRGKVVLAATVYLISAGYHMGWGAIICILTLIVIFLDWVIIREP